MTGAARQPEVVAPAADQSGDAGAAAATATPQPGAAAEEAQAAELAKAKAEVEERTADLKRITAEYANYRKRVDRDRAAVVEGATGTVLAGLLPVLDDIDRARAHGDLTGAFKAVADQLEGALEKFGLQPFGAVGDPFDPMLHEAVAHSGSAEATVPTCAVVLRRGFRLGERLLRPALVTVADPADEAPAGASGAAEPVAPTDLPADAADSAAPGKPADRSGESAASASASASASATASAGAAWTPPASAPGGSAHPPAGGQPEPAAAGSAAGSAGAGSAGAGSGVAEEGESPVDWFDKSGEQQD